MIQTAQKNLKAICAKKKLKIKISLADVGQRVLINTLTRI